MNEPKTSRPSVGTARVVLAGALRMLWLTLLVFLILWCSDPYTETFRYLRL